MWFTILIGVGGPLVGLFVGTILTGRRDRNSELRGRMLTAADDLMVDALAALTSFDRLQRAMWESQPDVWLVMLDQAVSQTDGVDARAARMRLLFGETAASAAADRISSLLHELVDGARLVASFYTGRPFLVAGQPGSTFQVPTPEEVLRMHSDARENFDEWLQGAHHHYHELPITARREILDVGGPLQRWRSKSELPRAGRRR